MLIPREQAGGCRERPPRQCCWVLAERSPVVAPVGAWVEESGPGGPQESLAFAAAFQVEEELKEQQQEKAASLRRFQGEVKQRVNRQVRMRWKQQLQKSCEEAERESCLATRCWDSALRLTPKKSTRLFCSRPAPAIRCPAAPVQWHGGHSQPFQQQAHTLSRTMKQVRRRLASCRTLPQGTAAPELPGGIWRQEKPDSCKMAVVPAEDESEEVLLPGHHDLPAELQDQGMAPHPAQQDDDFYIKIKFEKFCDGSVKDSSLSEPPQRLHNQHQAPLVLWAGVDQEETKKQHQNQYLRNRRLFMTIEREQVKEQLKQRERQKRIAEIKSKKEKQRRVEEQRMQEAAEQQEPPLGEETCRSLAQLKLEERRVRKVEDKPQRNKEQMRYIDALRAQMKEKIKLYHIDLPPLCSCGSDFWDSHPDTCANNCVFYKNHKAYSQALRSLLSSSVPAGRNSLVLPPPPQDLALLFARL